MSSLRVLITIAFLFNSSSAVLAQPMVDEEDLALAYGEKDFVSIATGTKQLVRKAPSVATVITAEDISRLGLRTLEQALETVPGVHVGRSDNHYYPQYTFRGIFNQYTPQVLVLENGIPRTSQFLGERGVGSIGYPLENIARIEVIRGPGSALYGADAYSGVINIITKTSADIDGTQVGIGAGSSKSWASWVSHGGSMGPIAVAAHLMIGATEGDDGIVRQDAQTGMDQLFGTRASHAPGSVNTGRETIDGNLDLSYGNLRWRVGYQQRDNMGTGAGVIGALDPYGKTYAERATSDLIWDDNAVAQDLAVTVQASFLHYKEFSDLNVFPSGAFGGAFAGNGDSMQGAPRKWERQGRYSAAATYTAFADHRIRVGLGHDELSIYKTEERKNFTFNNVGALVPMAMHNSPDNDLFLLPQTRKLNYAYVQDEWSLARNWTLTAGVRQDDYSDFGSTLNPRLALVWEAHRDITAKLMYGTAFRAPSFVEAYSTGSNPVNQGNSNLEPEQIKTLEAALTWQFRHNLSASLSVFKHELSSIIQPVTNIAPAIGSTYQNTGKQKGSGGELEVTWDASNSLRLSGHYAYQKNIDESTGNDAGYAPHHHLYSRADWRLVPGWQLSGQVNYVADRNRAYGDTRAEIPDYTAVDLTLRSERTKTGWDFSASVYNLFDADIREPSKTGSGITYDLPMPGRTFWLQARFSL
ncbi:MAG TPA: TonB-dependent receptor [Azonexus sp.]|nr:TonB-dependent receptor [Azonexus sp.]